MGRLDGSSPWRDFVLPFFNQEGGEPPDKLVFNLVLTGPGTVEIGPLSLWSSMPMKTSLPAHLDGGMIARLVSSEASSVRVGAAWRSYRLSRIG